MQKSFQVLFSIIFNFWICSFAFGQVESRTGSVQYQMRIGETTPIFDKATGGKISYADYERLTKADSRAYHLEPIINEYGESNSYKLRKVTEEEYRTGRFYKDLTERPKPGDPMPLVVLKGIDGKEYRSSDFKGKVIVFSFWIGLEMPFWSASNANELADFLKPYGSEIISIGIMQSSKGEILKKLASETFPFIPIPDAFGFHNKFEVTGIPSFIVMDKIGNIVAFTDGFEIDELKKALISASK